MNRIAITTTIAALLSSADVAVQRPASPVVEVSQSESCGCCSKWVEHMRASGFDVRTNNVEDIGAVKGAYRVRRKPSHST